MVFLSPRTNLYGGQKSSLQHGRLLAFLFPSLDFLWASIKADWESPSLYLWSRKSGRKIHTCKNLGKIGKNVDTKKKLQKAAKFHLSWQAYHLDIFKVSTLNKVTWHWARYARSVRFLYGRILLATRREGCWVSSTLDMSWFAPYFMSVVVFPNNASFLTS